MWARDTVLCVVVLILFPNHKSSTLTVTLFPIPLRSCRYRRRIAKKAPTAVIPFATYATGGKIPFRLFFSSPLLAAQPVNPISNNPVAKSCQYDYQCHRSNPCHSTLHRILPSKRCPRIHHCKEENHYYDTNHRSGSQLSETTHDA